MKATYYTPQHTFNEAKIIFERDQRHWDEIQNSFPEHLKDFTLDMSNLGSTCIRAVVQSPPNVSEQDTRDAMNWLKSLSGKIERGFRKEEGTFYWINRMKKQDEKGEYDYIVFIEKCNPLSCEIVKVTKTVEVFESVCNQTP